MGDSPQTEGLQSVVSKSDSPPTPTNKKKSRNRCRTFLDYARFAVEVLGLLGLIYYACLTRGSLKEAQETANEAGKATNAAVISNKISRLNSRLERRPYVGIENLQPQALSAKGTLSSEVRNYGASPARGVYAYGVFKKSEVNWRIGTCNGQDQTMNIDIAGPAIFQGTKEPIEIAVEPTSITSPLRPYLAVCLTFMDMQGPFHNFDDPTQGPPCSPYSIKHLYGVASKNGMLTFTPIYTSIEGAAPRLDTQHPCYGE
jgi:hypothetical protein